MQLSTNRRKMGMKRNPLPLLFCLLLLYTSLVNAGRLPTQYHVVDLGVGTFPQVLDDDGTFILQGPDGYTWRTVKNPLVASAVLAASGAPNGVFPNAILHGVVVGQSRDHATLWRLGQPPLDLGTLGSAVLYSSAHALSQNVIVGACSSATALGAPTVPCFWSRVRSTPGKAQPLPTLGGPGGSANAATPDGFLCGTTDTTTRIQHATCWNQGRPLDLTPTEPLGSWVEGVTKTHLVLGGSFFADAHFRAQPFVWTPHGGLVRLGILPGHARAFLTAIAGGGHPVAVGVSCRDAPDEERCIGVRMQLDETGHGTMEALQGMLDTPHLLLTETLGVNTHGVITGVGIGPDFRGHGLLLVPVGGDTNDDDNNNNDDPEDD